MTNTYIDCITYSKAPTGLMLNAQYGNLGRIQTCAQAATSLTTVAPLTVALAQYDALYVTDGPSSEILTVGAGGAQVGASSIPLQTGTQYAHAGGAAYCTDGIQGSLGQALFESARYLEDICYQPLWSTTYTGEILTMPTMRAAIDNRNNLHFRPRHFPITALTGITLAMSPNAMLTCDPTQAIIDMDQQTVDMPTFAAQAASQMSQSGPYFWYPLTRANNAWLTLSYTAGFPVGQLPPAVTRAATLLVSDFFGQMSNPVGADQINQGKRQVFFMLRGDTSGESLLLKQAKKLLGPYISQGF